MTRERASSFPGSGAAGDVGQAAELVESLRRIALSLTSGMDLRDVLQAIVDAICDHTQWQLSWIYAMDTDGGYGEIVARRDRMEYTQKSPKQRWPFDGNPALDALRRNEVIAFRDVREADEYPELRASALSRGVVSTANIPLSSTDPRGRAMVLCVQSRQALLDDPTQISFLKAVASLASLAASNAGLLSEARRVAARASETAQLLSSTMDAVSAGTPSREVLRLVEETTKRTVIVFDSHGNLFSAGTVPPELGVDQSSWEARILEIRASVYRKAHEALGSGERAVPLAFDLARGQRLFGYASRFGNDDRWMSTVVSVGAASTSDAARHHSAGTATAMVLLRERLAFEAQSMLQRDVVQELLRGRVDDPYEFTARAAFAGLHVDEPNYLVIAQRTAEVDRSGRANGLARTLSVHAQRWPGAVLQVVKGKHVFILPAARARSADLDVFLAGLASITLDGSPALLVTAAPGALTAEDFGSHWKHGRQTLELAAKLGRRGIVKAEDFGAYRVLLPALQGDDIVTFINGTIGPLVDADGGGNGDLFLTAEAFANSSGRFQETARRLHIHVSTLRYRLQRIAMLLGRDLSDEETRFEVSLAIRLERLRQGVLSESTGSNET